jgi:acyl-CoA reductase-like NAD-dependent aldehyde dehydrogenase
MASVSFTSNFVNTINGKAATSNETRDAINPATEEVIATVPSASRQQLDETVDAAWAAFPAWRSTPIAERQEGLRKAAKLIDEHAAEFVDLLVKEVGKTQNIAQMEVKVSSDWLNAVSMKSLEDEVVMENDERKVIQRYVPLGVCAGIIAWNFPLTILVWKMAPALLTGNCIIIKPSPYAPLAVSKFVELAQQVFPPGVLSLLNGSDDLGPWMTEHPKISKISLTGSTNAGKSVMKSASSTLKRVTLELGGNDPAIVLEDADPKALAPQLFWAIFANSGQICVASKRIYVHEKIYDAFRDELVAYARNMKVGNAAEKDTAVGPVQNKAQYEKVLTFLEDSKNNGHKFALGGGDVPKGKGYFIPITIIDNPPEDSKIVREEPFGPIVPLLKWSKDEEVLKRANDSDFGLGASVWGTDLNRLQSFAERLESGTVWINEAQIMHPDQAFGGFKQSGIGVEHSRSGLTSWTNIQSVTIKKTNAGTPKM